MEAKEKAKELVYKMNVIHFIKLGGKNSKSKGLPVSMYDDQIKQCALIAVDEILNDTDASSPFEVERLKFWQEVKQEIESYET